MAAMLRARPSQRRHPSRLDLEVGERDRRLAREVLPAAAAQRRVESSCEPVAQETLLALGDELDGKARLVRETVDVSARTGARSGLRGVEMPLEHARAEMQEVQERVVRGDRAGPGIGMQRVALGDPVDRALDLLLVGRGARTARLTEERVQPQVVAGRMEDFFHAVALGLLCDVRAHLQPEATDEEEIDDPLLLLDP